MTGSSASNTPHSATSDSRPAVDVLQSALLSCKVAAGFRAQWESPDSTPDAFSLVDASDFTAREYTNVFLVDQYFRWSCGRGMPAEAYCRVLRRRFEHQLDDFEFELAEQEFLLRSGTGNGPDAELGDFQTRFPELAERLGLRFGASALEVTVALDPTERIEDTDAGSFADGLARTFLHTDRKVTRAVLGQKPDDDEGSSLILESDSQLPVSDSVLGQSRPFARLAPSLVKEIERQLVARVFKPGEALMRQGEVGDGLFLITKGKVEISVTDKDGQSHVIATAGKGEILGEMALITEEPRTADVTATRSVIAKFLPVKAFDELASRNPVISRVLTQLLGERLGTRGRDVLAGKTMEGYRIQNRLGKGGMAIVYQAEQTETAETVALKMMSHRLVYDQCALDLFEQESRIIESFNHPHIVRMYGRFKAFRSFFIVLEYCDGVSLDVTIRRKRKFELPEFRTVVGQLASALAYAHDRNIVHRDIKPSNVMLTESGGVKLMDFGLANPVDDADSKGVVAGTPRYMAPEQLKGHIVDTRADVFALGVTAWKLLTGDDLIPEATLADIQKRHNEWQVPDVECDDPEVRDFFQASLEYKPANRIVDLNEIARWAE